MRKVSNLFLKIALTALVSVALTVIFVPDVYAAPEHVYATKTGKVWHTDRNCDEIAGSDAWYMTFEEYQKEKKNSTECSLCKNGGQLVDTIKGKTYVYNGGFTTDKEIQVNVDTNNVEVTPTVDEGIVQDASANPEVTTTSSGSSKSKTKTSTNTTVSDAEDGTTGNANTATSKSSKSSNSKTSTKTSTKTATTTSSGSGSKSSASSGGSSSSGGKELMTEKQRRNKFRSRTNPKRGTNVVTPVRPASAGFSYADFGSYNDYNSNNGKGGSFIYLLGTIMTMEPEKQNGDDYTVAVMVNDCDGYQWYIRCHCNKDLYPLMKAELTGKSAYIYGTFAGYSGIIDRPMLDVISVIEVGGKALDMRRFR